MFVGAVSARAGGGGPVVLSTTVSPTGNAGNGTLTINGTNFGSTPVVTLNNLSVPVMSKSSTQIVADFPNASPPSSFTPGTYFLTIAFNQKSPTIFTVEICAVGATGAAGAIGPQGAPGAAGPAGVAGAPAAASDASDASQTNVIYIKHRTRNR